LSSIPSTELCEFSHRCGFYVQHLYTNCDVCSSLPYDHMKSLTSIFNVVASGK
jgi:hypothetical protein